MALFKKTIQVKSVKDMSRAIYNLRKCEIFRDVPEANIREMAHHMQRCEGKAGTAVIQQGEPGDYYYVLLTGSASVHRSMEPGQKPEVVAELGPGSGFGEEAIIANSTRNATVKLSSPSTLARVPREAFIDYIEKSLVTWLSPAECQKLAGTGAHWVDCREPEEGRAEEIIDALAMPLIQLRDRVGELDKDRLQICFCEDGRLSACGAFLMRQRGHDAAALRGGLEAMRSEFS